MTPPGWYPDPNEPGWLRFWDGIEWTMDIAQLRGRLSDEPSVGTIAANTERERVRFQLIAEIEQLRRKHEELSQRIVETSEVMLLQSVGIYHFAHPLDDAPAYKQRLEALERRYESIIKNNGAVSTTQKWAVNGSEREGAKMVSDLAKLMLRTYNNEVENVIKKLKPHNLNAAVARLDKLCGTVAKLGASMKLEISPQYHSLRVEEVRLTADYLQRMEEERERVREEKERMREAAKVRKEQEAEQERLEALLDKERQQYESAIASLGARGDQSAVEEHRTRLDEIQKMLDGAIARAANLRAGFVYVISNIGAFGEGVVKIGLTRRLDPLDRIRELHNASVPFRFDVHAVVFSEDAVSLETALHRAFEKRRVNLTNTHKEFFLVTPSEVRDALLRLNGDLLTFAELAEAHEWRQSEALRKSEAPSLPSLGSIREDCQHSSESKLTGVGTPHTRTTRT